MRKMKWVSLLLLCVLLSLTACSASGLTSEPAAVPSGSMSKYSVSYFDSFDTLITLTAYAPDQQTFDETAEQMHQLFLSMHRLYDNYNAYEGINNVYTLNQNAASAPVKVDAALYDLLKLCKEQQPLLSGKVNIAMGSVLSLWHDYREAGLDAPEQAALPPMDDLTQAAGHVCFDDVILNDEDMTVFFADPLLQLDLGAVAKGYATEAVAQALLESPLSSFVISAGGNVRAGHPPLDGRKGWGVGIQSPEGQVLSAATGDIVDVLFLADISVVTSGDYQRYYTVDGKRYHHLIDPQTLMPGDYFPSVTIVTQNSGLADLLSTAVFLMPYEEGRAFIDSLEDTEALWIFKDGTFTMTDGMKAYARSQGASAR